MGFFGFGKGRDEDVVDLSEMYKKKQANNGKSSTSTSINSMLNESSDSSNSNTSSEEYNENDSPEEKKRKLAKRLMDITDKLDEISNQIYHLQQRIEVLERRVATKGL